MIVLGKSIVFKKISIADKCKICVILYLYCDYIQNYYNTYIKLYFSNYIRIYVLFIRESNCDEFPNSASMFVPGDFRSQL